VAKQNIDKYLTKKYNEIVNKLTISSAGGRNREGMPMIQVSICVGSSCHLKGSYQIIQIFQDLLKKHRLEDKVDFKASFCLGRCTKGVSVKVDEEFVDDVTIVNAAEKFEEYILRRV
jgi:NADH:ubiquinone oxidoreductase subunit E